MKKSTFFSVVLLTLLPLGLTLVPNVSSQPENIKVVSYSWYVYNQEYFIVVGEVQNVGTGTIELPLLGGTIYTSDGVARAQSILTRAYVKYLVPQQKAPFYMDFPYARNSTGELSWLSIGVDRIDFTVFEANATSSYQYPDLTVKESSATVVEGVYWANGVIQNTGSQTAKNIRVIGTFYNASGNVVAMGHTGDDPLTPTSLAPSETLSFKVGAWDLNQTEVASNLKISSYSFLVLTEEPILSGTAPPPSTTTPTDTSPSSTNPSDSNSSNPADSTLWSTYAIVAVAAILGIVGTMLLLRKRKSQALKKRKAQVRRKQK
jgi:hypothetical protein